MGERGHIDLERAVDSIRIGHRHRSDLGDLDALIASIEREGLLQPPTITPDGVLVCGARRLAAIRHLGWKTTPVWVRSGLTGRLGQLLAEQDDNVLHKPLTPTEAAALYAELKQVMAEDAARRQAATQFTSGEQNPRSDGAATVAGPSPGVGEARAQAAQMITGRKSYTSLERINELRELAENPETPEHVRARALQELEGIDSGASITAAHQRTRAEVSLAELDQLADDPAQMLPVREAARHEATRLRQASTGEAEVMSAEELDRCAKEAIARLTQAKQTKKTPSKKTETGPELPARWSVRAFNEMWRSLNQWWTHYDPAEIAARLTDEQWQAIEETLTGTTAFLDEVRDLRATARRNTA